MQDQYISLNPDRTASEEKALRAKLYRQRIIEAQGGEASLMTGIQFGMTAAILLYSKMSHEGFKVWPIAASKTQGYTKIFMAFLGFYYLGHSYVMNKFGDSK